MHLFLKHTLVAAGLLGSLSASPASAAVQNHGAVGIVVGHVLACVDDTTGQENPAVNVTVAAVGSSAMTETGADGSFTLNDVPVQLTADIAVMGADGQPVAQRPNVPIWPSQTLDIGDLVINASLFGCGADATSE